MFELFVHQIRLHFFIFLVPALFGEFHRFLAADPSPHHEKKGRESGYLIFPTAPPQRKQNKNVRVGSRKGAAAEYLVLSSFGSACVTSEELGSSACMSARHTICSSRKKHLPAISATLLLETLLERTRFSEEMLVALSADDFSSMSDGAPAGLQGQGHTHTPKKQQKRSKNARVVAGCVCVRAKA